ncbi:MAG: aldolase catalytic domain-containing protein [Sedimentisphaerales bacterium]|nr:aldolase catalytic domain-containing protein [Sedimentisphaerales bacterium]
MYREEIKVLDCTIRDGGLINNHYFTDDFVRAVYKALSEAGIDYMEMGYRSSRKYAPPAEYGAWKYCDDEKIREIIDGIESDVKLSIMVDAHRVLEQEFAPVDQSPIDMIRIATYVKDIDKAIALYERVHDLGYETTINIMAISTENEFDLVEALHQIAKTQVGTVYIVDSFGYFFSEQIHYIVELFQKHLPGKRLGIHCHNNQQLAFANTIEAIRKDCNLVDGSLFGIGRGAGNCALELIMGFLKNPKFNIEPVLKVIQDYMIPMRNELEWGYIIPYMITGMLNRHPRSAIAVRDTENRDKYAEFYNEICNHMD